MQRDVWITVAMLAWATGVARAGVPANDQCASAEAIAGEGTFLFDNTNATSDGPNDSASCDAFGSTVIEHDVWFLWVAPCDGPVTARTCDGTTVDTKMAVYDAACPTGPDEELACNDDACGLQSSVTFTAVAGNGYRIRVGTYPKAAGGTGGFEITCGGVSCASGVGCQLPEQDGQGAGNIVGATSDLNPQAGFVVTDDFVADAGGFITSACWWGMYVDFSVPVDCLPGSGDDFAITYYNDDAGGGVPGSLRAGPFSVIVNSFQTGNIINASVDLVEWQHEAIHPPVNVTAGECVWLEIVNNTSGSCVWLWETASPGDGRSVQGNGDEISFKDFDLAFCLDVSIDPFSCGPLPPLPNDFCADATAITGYGPFAFDNFTATTDGPAPVACKVETANDVWYCWTAPCEGQVLVRTCGGTTIDSTIEIYDGCGCPPQETDLLGCNDDACGLQSEVVFEPFDGATYLIRIGKAPGGFGGGAGTFEILPLEDCNGNGIPDLCDPPDCNGNSVPDDCDIASGFSFDCNFNGVPDECDIDSGFSADCNGNLIPDECEPLGPDCNGNGIIDECELDGNDCNGNGVPDDCELGVNDCDGNGVPDECDLDLGLATDCNLNGIPDICDVIGGGSADVNGNFIPDECEVIIFKVAQEFLAAGPCRYDEVGNLDELGFFGFAGPAPTLDAVVIIPGPTPANAGSVQVFRNQGTSGSGWNGLIANPPFAVGRDPTGIALGFFDPDPFVDMAVTNAGDDNVMIFRNTGAGDGTFTLTQTVALGPGTSPRSVAAGDFTGDGLADLVVVNDGTSTLVLAENQLAMPGTFALSGSPVTIGTGPRTVCPEDMDDDKDLDAVVANSGSDDVSVVLNLGGGSFDPMPLTLGTGGGSEPVELEVTDVDGNGFKDIVTTNVGNGTISVIANLGGLVFDPHVDLAVGANPRSVDSADFDLDADADLAVIADDAQIGGPAVVIVVNASTPGSVTFQARVAYDAQAEPVFIQAGDFDDDGSPDVVTANIDDGTGTGSVTVLRVDTCPTDVDGDGETDVNDLVAIITDWGPCPGCPGDINRDGVIDVNDLVQIVLQWGGCP